MDKLSFDTGGFPIDTDVLDAMQQAWSVFEKLASLCGDLVIVSGCQQSGGSINPGYVAINGELLYMTGGAPQTFVKITSSTDTVSYEDGQDKTFVTHRCACFDSTVAVDGNSYKWSDFVRPSSMASLSLNKLDASVFSQKIAELEARIALVSGDTSNLGALVVPKGGIIMWAQALPNKAVTLDEIKASTLPYGYLPCGRMVIDGDKEKVLAAWNEYLKELGLSPIKNNASFHLTRTFIDFTSVTGIDLTDRFVLGAGKEYPLKYTGGQSTVVLKNSEMPKHNHAVDDYYFAEKLGDTGDQPSLDVSAIIGSGKSDSDNTKMLYAVHSTHYEGSDGPHENMPPYVAIYYLMKMI